MLLGGFGLVAAGCSGGSDSSNATATTKGSTSSAAACTTVAEETAGPYPGDGSNGPDVLTKSGVVRKDIRASIGRANGVAQGVPYTIQFTVVDVANGCTPLTGAAVYVWHCDRGGNYSMYSQAAANQNYLRGVQPVDANGVAAFTSIFPACYPGRWPHVHFEVYPSVAAATSGGTLLATSQIALPKDACDAVYATTGYEQSVSALSQVSIATDTVFSDGVSTETPSMTGNASSGFVSSLAVGVDARV